MTKKLKLFLASFFGLCVILACLPRILHTYLEDDLLWSLPLVSQLNQTLPFIEQIKTFQQGQLTLFDGIYLSLMLSIFNTQLKFWVMGMFLFHFLISYMLYTLLYKRIRLSNLTSFFSAIVYLTFFGHFNGYERIVSISHLMVVFFILLITNLYMKTNELYEERKKYKIYFGLTMLAALLASFMKLSMIIAPLIIGFHILVTTEKKEKIVPKFDLWLPVLCLLLVYQWILITIIGSQGMTLSELLDPIHELVGQVTISKSLLLFFGLLLGFRFILYGLSRKNILNPIIKGIKRLSYAILLIPHFLTLCLFAWLGSLHSASSYPVSLRMHTIFYPEGLTLIVFLMIALIFMFFFIRHALRVNKHLLIFVIWYASLLPFLGLTLDPTPSKYLIYVSPLFATIICVFFFEILPYHFSLFSNKWLRAFLCISFVLLALINVYSIRVRLHRTVLGDYSWSYDYVKIANVIGHDIKQKKKNEESKVNSLCINGVTTIPALDSWRSFLGDDFNEYGPFIMTLQTVLNDKHLKIRLNQECNVNDTIYSITKKTVIDGQGNSVEPFYHFFDTGIKALKSKNTALASEQFYKAINSPPFLIEFVTAGDMFSNFNLFEKLSRASNIIWKTYGQDYEQTPKMQVIENMIQEESLDYGMVLTLFSYLHCNGALDQNCSFTQSQWANVASKFISLNEINEFPWKEYFTKEDENKFRSFIERLNPPQRSDNTIDVGEYKNYKIYWSQEYYFGIPYDEPFDLAKRKRFSFHDVILSKSRHDVINHIRENKNVLFPVAFNKTKNYQDFKMRYDGTQWIITYEGSLTQNLDFTAQSEIEAKLVIDSFLSL